MGLFGFGKSYTREDLQKEISLLEGLYLQAMSGSHNKIPLLQQYNKVIEVCKKGNFNGSEMVQWLGSYTSLRNVTPPVQVLIEIM